ncbi:YdbH domain-containing protein [Qipengyuania sp. DSG2-2]|uniref:intermembrane phospholipid transport protein YdbH family protein n=1 Tax=Qipengyuania sp. DGS2-2 TaxID=3349631 RepID=UPI0036D2582D
MAEAEEIGPDVAEEAVPTASSLRRRRNWVARVLLVLFLVLVAVLLVLWANRTDYAKGFIDEELEAYDLPITYKVEDISGEQQVLTNIVVGDPERPDLTVDRIEVNLVYRLTGPELGQIRVFRPRLWGEAGPEGISFGTLDELLFGTSEDEAGLPERDIAIVDGRARIDTPYGPIGLKADGEGVLADGFLGMMAANAPRLVLGDCVAEKATLYGKFTITGGRPRISGPLRLAEGTCGGGNGSIALAGAALPVVVTADEDFSGIAATYEGRIASLSAAGTGAGPTNVSGRLEYGEDRLVGSYDITARALKSGAVGASRVVMGGSFRSAEGFASWDVSAEGTAENIQIGRGFTAALDDAQAGAADTLAAPIIARLARALEQQVPGSQLRASIRYRTGRDGATVTIPRAVLANRGGAVLASLSRGSAVLGTPIPRLSGNIATGGPDLPRIEGRMERAANGQLALNLGMAEYGVGSDRIAIPQMTVRQSPGGALAFEGLARASGKLPGGTVQGLEMPVSGSWTSGAGLALWNGCTRARFDKLVYANLELGRQDLTMCPASGKPILQAGAGAGARGFRIAAGVPSLAVSGTLGGTRLKLGSGPVGFAWPGTLKARALDVELGPPETGVRFAVSELTGRLGDELAGSFAEADVRLATVPLDILQASGDWAYRDGIIAIDQGAFVLEDREEVDRFEPLIARDASLTLADNVITANALLRTPANDAVITALDLRHDLTTSAGFADLDVPGIRFGDALQPTDLTYLALGVVANVRGPVTGSGRIDWNSDTVTSTGRFSSEGLDLAAIFGPVENARGTIVFDDLLGLTTAPDQRLSIGAINPGIEVFDGTVQFSLTNGELLAVQGGSWPFLGGTLEMAPSRITIGLSEVREYTFKITGLEASQLLERLELANFSADGVFDGQMKIVFDRMGNGRIDQGLLSSRAPGGSLSYVGELTYEDLSPIANFAFDALRSLQYERMEVGIDGPLTGDILTKVRFDGVSQGEGAKRNFITRRLANLPLRFNVNIRAPFYQLLTNVRSIYDPAFVRDPRELGLVSEDGTRLRPSISGEDAPEVVDPDFPATLDAAPSDPSVQSSESENMR